LGLSYLSITGEPAMADPRRRAVVRTGAIVFVPVAGIAADFLVNLITARWNWWMFGVLIALTLVLLAGAVLEHPARRAAQTGSESAVWGADSAAVLPSPHGTRVFTGRRAQLDQLTELVDPDRERFGPLLLAVTGLAGSGKTELAIQAARRLSGRYPDGQFWLELRTYAAAESRMPTAVALRMLLNALGVPPDPRATDVAALSRTWQVATRDRRLLLVLDDVDSAEQFAPLLPSASGSAALVTSRHALIGLDPDRAVTLDTFEPREAREMAAAILQRAGQPDSEAAHAIASRFQLPLAVRQIADLKAANPGLDLALLEGGEAGQTAIALTTSFQALARQARRDLRRIAHYPGALITPAIAAVITNRTLEAARRLLAELYRRGLLIGRGEDGGYRMHDLVRAAALRESAARDPARRIAAGNDRIYRYTDLAVVEACWMLYRGHSVTGMDTRRHLGPGIGPPRHATDVAAMAWLDRHYADLLAVERRCVGDRSPLAWRLVFELEFYQRLRGFYAEIAELHGRTLAFSESSGDRLGQAAMHHNLGLLEMRTGEYLAAKTRFETAGRLYAGVDHAIGQAEIHHELAKVTQWLGDLQAARAHAEAGFALAEAHGGIIERAMGRSDVGVADRLEGSLDSAREHAADSLRLFEEAGQRRGIATCRRELGILDEASGRYAAARDHLRYALTTFEEIRDVMNQADTHRSLALVDSHAGDSAAARDHAETALTLSTSINHRRGKAEAHLQLGDISDGCGNAESAREHWTQALELYQALNMQTRAQDVEELLAAVAHRSHPDTAPPQPPIAPS